jgi:hypothetical protein
MRGPVTAGEGAAAVADHDGAVLGGAEQAGAAPEVEDFAFGAQDDAADPAVTQQALHGGGQHRAAAEDVAATVGVELAGQGGGVDDDVDGVGGVDPAMAVLQPHTGQTDERVVTALRQRPDTPGRVLGVGRFELVEGSFQHGELFGRPEEAAQFQVTGAAEPEAAFVVESFGLAPVEEVVGM